MSGSTVTYRAAAAEDLPAIIALLRDDVLGATRNPSHEAAASLYDAAWAEILADANNSYVVAELSGTLIGCYQLTFIRGLSHAGGLRAQIESVRKVSALQ
jgi:hypothetical protein